MEYKKKVISMKSRRVQIHVGEPEPYRGGLRVVPMGKVAVRGSERLPEGHRIACSCGCAGVSVVPDQEGYNMLRYPKAWIWREEFWKTLYYF